MTDYFPGFTRHQIDIGDGIMINAVCGGAGPPVLLLHGDPQSHLCWRKVAPLLARHFHIVAADLRGYGESSKPAGHEDHSTYSKRVMADDQVELMRRLGHDTFAVVGHDRGARVTHRMLLDHPHHVTAAAVVDIVPTATMFSLLADRSAAAYFWWYLNIQPAPMPETMIAADIDAYFDAHLGLARTHGTFEPGILESYLANYRQPEHIHAVCEDYRASFTIDRDHHDTDTAAGRVITTPLAVIWGRDGAIDRLDPQAIWSAHASTITGIALPGGHFLAEENPTDLADVITTFLTHALTPETAGTPR